MDNTGIVNMILQRFSRVNLTCAKDIVFFFQTKCDFTPETLLPTVTKKCKPMPVSELLLYTPLEIYFQSISVLTRALIIYFKVSMSESTPCSSDFID